MKRCFEFQFSVVENRAAHLTLAALFELSRNRSRKLNAACGSSHSNSLPACCADPSNHSLCLKSKHETMDYEGQRLSELLFYWIIISFGAVGWVIGYIRQDFTLVFYAWLIGVVLSVVVSCLCIQIVNFLIQGSKMYSLRDCRLFLETALTIDYLFALVDTQYASRNYLQC